MKEFFTILPCILYQTTFGQFGIINDKDGFVNVRNSPNISNNIIDTLHNGQVVFTFESEVKLAKNIILNQFVLLLTISYLRKINTLTENCYIGIQKEKHC